MCEDIPKNNCGLPLGVGNPLKLGDSKVQLYECPGEIYSIIDFVKKSKHLLNQHEQDLIAQSQDLLCQIHIPKYLTKCLTRTPEFAIKANPMLTVRRSGGRSAYWVERNIKFKGCRPVLDNTDFPIEILPFGTQKIEYRRIPFGTMRAESVMREILGYCFLKTHHFNTHSIPICVYKYQSDKHDPGYCLVSKTVGEVRIEEFIPYPDCTIEDIIRAKHSNEQTIKQCPIGAELSLRGIDLWQYIEQKSSFLAKMHFNGGFRGILNSNIGNDVIVGNETGDFQLYLCDFDTFKIVSIPKEPETSFVETFVLQCIVEVAKGSLSILDYVDLPGGFSCVQIADALGEIYFNKSSLWHAYERKFYRNAELLGWDSPAVEKAIDKMRRTEAFANILCSCILNSRYVNELSQNRSIFYPHN